MSYTNEEFIYKKRFLVYLQKLNKKKLVFLLCYHVFIVLVSFICKKNLPNQNNPTGVWLRLIGMHNEKTWFLVKYFLKNCYIFWQPNSSNDNQTRIQQFYYIKTMVYFFAGVGWFVFYD